MLRLMVMTAPAVAVVAVLKPEILPSLLRVAGAAIVNTLVVGALAGLHALLVVSLFRPGAGIDLWLALLVTGVVTVVLWAVARPFRRLVSMVSLTQRAVRRHRAGRGQRSDVAGVAADTRRGPRRPADPLVGRAPRRRHHGRIPGRWPPGGRAGSQGRAAHRGRPGAAAHGGGTGAVAAGARGAPAGAALRVRRRQGAARAGRAGPIRARSTTA